MKKFILDRRKIKIPVNPTLSFAKSLVKEAKGYDEIVSIGGGSTIDVGKLLAFDLKIRHTAIPTTAGSGSEVTKFAVFIDNGKKISIEDDKLIPDKFIIDPSLVVSLSPYQTASSGLDALCHAIESYWSPLATQESRYYSFAAINLIMDNLEKSYKDNGNEEWRKYMLWAANLSGRAINITRTSVCHAISYPLTIHYGIPHGIACALTLSAFMYYYNINSFFIGITRCSVHPKKIELLIKSLNINVYELLSKVDFELVINEALESERVRNVPFASSKKNLIKLLKDVCENTI